MSNNAELLSEVYLTLKQYIPSKDRQEASDHLMSILVDSLPDEDLAEFADSDSYTKRSYEEYTGESDTDATDSDGEDSY